MYLSGNEHIHPRCPNWPLRTQTVGPIPPLPPILHSPKLLIEVGLVPRGYIYDSLMHYLVIWPLLVITMRVARAGTSGLRPRLNPRRGLRKRSPRLFLSTIIIPFRLQVITIVSIAVASPSVVAALHDALVPIALSTTCEMTCAAEFSAPNTVSPLTGTTTSHHRTSPCAAPSPCSSPSG